MRLRSTNSQKTFDDTLSDCGVLPLTKVKCAGRGNVAVGRALGEWDRRYDAWLPFLFMFTPQMSPWSLGRSLLGPCPAAVAVAGIPKTICQGRNSTIRGAFRAPDQKLQAAIASY